MKRATWLLQPAHIMYVLRDAYDGARLGYYNVPREVLELRRVDPTYHLIFDCADQLR